VFLSNYDDLEVVAEAEDGAQAIELCAEARPDVVLMDLLMPRWMALRPRPACVRPTPRSR